MAAVAFPAAVEEDSAAAEVFIKKIPPPRRNWILKPVANLCEIRWTWWILRQHRPPGYRSGCAFYHYSPVLATRR